MRKLLATSYGLLALLYTPLGVANGNDPQADSDRGQSMIEQHCPYEKLHRNNNIINRHTLLTPNDDPFFLSEHYCFGYFNHGSEDTRKLPAYFKDQEAHNLNNRYTKAYNALSTNKERVAFVHLFLKQLSQKVLVMPLTAKTADKQIKVILTMKNTASENTSLWQMTITPSNHTEIYDGLMTLSDESKIAQKWPELAELVEHIIN